LTDNLDALAYPWAALWLAAGGAILLGLCALISSMFASSTAVANDTTLATGLEFEHSGGG
jgi:hypothetical protein